ncbi:MAG: polyprenyl synthetase family protein [Mariprofundales bacterium]
METMQAYLQYMAQDIINPALQEMLLHQQHGTTTRLFSAMQYSLLAGGKRIRPILLHACFEACGGQIEDKPISIMPAMLSIECIHTYSLIHDDLPCMDDDDLRRGLPTCHNQFDEATAVLAADALQTLGFSLLADVTTSDVKRVQLLRLLATAAGMHGMVGGQMLDIQAENAKALDVLAIERIHLRKTGALLRYCCEAGSMLASSEPNTVLVEACSHYGKAVGLLFQIADDILDATASSDVLGKNVGKDAAQHKATYVTLLGINDARRLGKELLEIALNALKPMGSKAGRLEMLARYILERQQ